MIDENNLDASDLGDVLADLPQVLDPTPATHQDPIMDVLTGISNALGDIVNFQKNLDTRLSSVEARSLAGDSVAVTHQDVADKKFTGRYARSVDIVTRPVAENPSEYPNANFGGLINNK